MPLPVVVELSEMLVKEVQLLRHSLQEELRSVVREVVEEEPVQDMPKGMISSMTLRDVLGLKPVKRLVDRKKRKIKD